MSESKVITICEVGPKVLFEYVQHLQNVITIEIEALQKQINYRVNGNLSRINITYHSVTLGLFRYTYVDNFPMLSLLSSLIKVFERRQFGVGAKSMSIYHGSLPETNEKLYLFCKVAKLANNCEGMEIGWKRIGKCGTNKNSVILNIAEVYHLNNALHRAMNWIKPNAKIMHDDINKCF